jgi:hypothetical protein
MTILSGAKHKNRRDRAILKHIWDSRAQNLLKKLIGILKSDPCIFFKSIEQKMLPQNSQNFKFSYIDDSIFLQKPKKFQILLKIDHQKILIRFSTKIR